ncbi:MAG: Asparagine synthetase [Candidatus Nomurabacteria bacterium GW2011_GWA1_46_11]|uniref:asparagine synthase (glutamine-hydrolyzing) n=1 Tax=Candidatus Nomurabacteria bacterium GW2011_GWA1_46_11 TaxID=1618732 RepID=A0A0G1NMY3_9BACT|nr:MAG: Asparagine synthetase [Microgenomates group bacterium GW2011_GWB1_44_8]KKU21964.1 MAG: Asparagine synthetase [Candidatus Nomurabacteria bacterium GW2011_GWA1_46_11]
MCGLTALVEQRGNSIDPVLFRQINGTLTHRGPDESGIWSEKNVALGSRRLSIIDLNSGHQPLTNEDKSLVIVFNGEIYNYRQLRKSLLSFHQFKTQSDTEVILHLFEDRGEETPKLLDGMFAFAIYNRLTRTLFLARDHLGIKPLYFTSQKGLFLAASEPRAIITHPSIRKSLDPSSLLLLLLLEHIPSPFSIWQGISKLPPGHFLKYKEGKLVITRYWQPTFNPKIPLGQKDLSDQLDESLTSAVARSLVSDVPVGAFLSGGVDSSTICALAKKKVNKLHTFSIGFPEKSYDESYYSHLVAKHLDTIHHHQTFREKDVLESISLVAKHMDEPLADYSLLPSFLLTKFTHKYVKVALSGDGGDEVFGGYPTNWAHQVFPLWQILPSPIKRLASSTAATIFPFSDSNFSPQFVAEKFIGGDPNPFLREILWPGAFTPVEVLSLLNNHGNLGDLDSWLLSTLISPLLDPQSNQLSLSDQLSLLRLRHYLGEQNLVKVDRASMAYSLEVRPPYLSVPLVEFATKLPPSALSPFLRTKILLKKVAARYLPSEIVNRPKKGFGIPMARWLNRDLNPLMHQLLDPVVLKRQRLFDPQFVEKLISQHENRQKNNYKKIWTLMTFQLWSQNWLQ